MNYLLDFAKNYEIVNLVYPDFSFITDFISRFRNFLRNQTFFLFDLAGFTKS